MKKSIFMVSSFFMFVASSNLKEMHWEGKQETSLVKIPDSIMRISCACIYSCHVVLTVASLVTFNTASPWQCLYFTTYRTCGHLWRR